MKGNVYMERWEIELFEMGEREGIEIGISSENPWINWNNEHLVPKEELANEKCVLDDEEDEKA